MPRSRHAYVHDHSSRLGLRINPIVLALPFPSTANLANVYVADTGVGALQNFMSLESPDSDARSSRIALRDELVGKLVFDDDRVFKRLALDRLSPEFVEKCAHAFETDQDLLDAKRELEKVVAAAIGKPIEELEADEDIQDSFGIRKVKKKVEAKKMYKPLVCYRSLTLSEY